MDSVTMTTGGQPREQAGFWHPALFYGSQHEYLDQLVPFVTDALAQSAAVLVAVPGPNLAVLRAALGADADRVTMADMTQAGRNPGRILGGVLGAFAQAHSETPVRIIGEPIWPDRTPTEYPACVQHEALINAAFANRCDAAIVCPYDTTALGTAVIADARATHPVIWQDGHETTSVDYAPEHVVARYNQPLTTAEDAVGYTLVEPHDLADVRQLIAEYAAQLGLSIAQISDLQLIATELASNSLLYTDGDCQVHLWQDNGHLVCQVRDSGHLTDPLAGRRPAPRHQGGGRGLLLVNELADLLRIHTSRHGTTIHAYLRLAHN
jgi:anti-sigma regulatory factor (Ser/Thr protein kinase)